MMRGKIKGFTIIEILLFIAISGALVAIVMSSIGGRQQRVQFTDAMRDLQAFVETQLSYAQTGVNEVPGQSLLCSGATAGGTSKNCINLGRAMIFASASSIANSYIVVGTRLTADYAQACSAPQNTIFCASPHINSTGMTSYDILWGAQFIVGRYKNDSGADAGTSKSLAFMRDPRATSIIPIVFSNSSSSILQQNIETINNTSTYNTASSQRGDDVSAYYCFKSADGKMNAALTIVGSQIDMVFEPSSTTYNCNP